MSMFCSRVKLRSILWADKKYKGPLETINIKTATKQRRAALARRGSCAFQSKILHGCTHMGCRDEQRDSCRSDRVCPSVFRARFQRTAPCRRHTERQGLTFWATDNLRVVWSELTEMGHVRAGCIPLAARASQSWGLSWMASPLYQSLGLLLVSIKSRT